MVAKIGLFVAAALTGECAKNKRRKRTREAVRRSGL